MGQFNKQAQANQAVADDFLVDEQAPILEGAIGEEAQLPDDEGPQEAPALIGAGELMHNNGQVIWNHAPVLAPPPNGIHQGDQWAEMPPRPLRAGRDFGADVGYDDGHRHAQPQRIASDDLRNFTDEQLANLRMKVLETATKLVELKAMVDFAAAMRYVEYYTFGPRTEQNY